MIAFRIFKTTLAHSAMTGQGAFEYGGRWNSPGRHVVYAAESRALAALEILAHLQDSGLLAKGYSIITLDFDPSLVQDLDASELPAHWTEAEHPAPKALGNAWLAQGSSAVLRVPGAAIPAESNYLLNPRHPDFSEVAFSDPEPFRCDPRL